MQGELEKLKPRHKRIFGWHEYFGIYDLESFDGGKSWYSMLTDANGRRQIQSTAEQAFPGLMLEVGIVDTSYSQQHDASTNNQQSQTEKNSKKHSKDSDKDQIIPETVRAEIIKNRNELMLRPNIREQAVCKSLPKIV